MTLNQLRTQIIELSQKYPEHNYTLYNLYYECIDSINYDEDEQSAIQKCQKQINTLINGTTNTI